MEDNPNSIDELFENDFSVLIFRKQDGDIDALKFL
jgi:hypothetical protein